MSSAVARPTQKQLDLHRHITNPRAAATYIIGLYRTNQPYTHLNNTDTVGDFNF